MAVGSRLWRIITNNNFVMQILESKAVYGAAQLLAMKWMQTLVETIKIITEFRWLTGNELHTGNLTDHCLLLIIERSSTTMTLQCLRMEQKRTQFPIFLLLYFLCVIFVLPIDKKNGKNKDCLPVCDKN